MAREFNPSNKPCTCLFCGRKLAFKYHSRYESCVDPSKPPKSCHCGCTDFETNPKAENGIVWRCMACWAGAGGRPYRKLVSRTKVYDLPGAYGDGFFCNLDCGVKFARIAAQLGFRAVKKEG